MIIAVSSTVPCKETIYWKRYLRQQSDTKKNLKYLKETHLFTIEAPFKMKIECVCAVFKIYRSFFWYKIDTNQYWTKKNTKNTPLSYHLRIELVVFSKSLLPILLVIFMRLWTKKKGRNVTINEKRSWQKLTSNGLPCHVQHFRFHHRLFIGLWRRCWIDNCSPRWLLGFAWDSTATPKAVSLVQLFSVTQNRIFMTSHTLHTR